MYFGTRTPRGAPPTATPIGVARDLGLRNASLSYRPIGASGRYPDWVRALRGKSGVYLIRERQRDGIATPSSTSANRTLTGCIRP